LATASAIMASANTDPTDRSMPAVRMARNMPIASIELTAVCLKILATLRQVKNTSGCSA
jgi:hypothetical protein